MRYARGLVAVGVVLCGALEARAQFPVAPLPGGVVGSRSFGITYSGRRISAGIYLGGYGTGPVFGPRCCAPFLYGGPTFSSVTVITQPPIVARPLIFDNPPPAAQPPQQGDMDLLDPIVFRPRPKPGQGRPEMPDDAPLPGALAGGFRPVRPEDRMQAQQAPPPEGKDDPKRPPLKERLPRPAEPERKPKDEAGRQMVLGRQALTTQEYGRAAQRFQEAVRNAPEEPTSYFLLAQACFALGKYREAVATIHEGLRRQPDWPTSDFRPIELYGANVADYTEHLEALREALDRNPRDPVLLFLYAYQLWFDGRQDEARPLFRKALPLVAEPRFIHLFLDGKGGLRVVMR